jgi:hypothetical protein
VKHLILFILCLFYSLAALPSPSNYVDYPDFKQLPPEKQLKMITKLHQVLITWEAQTTPGPMKKYSLIEKYQLKQKLDSFMTLFIAKAIAGDRFHDYLSEANKHREKICMYGGWVSLIKGGRCIHPKYVKGAFPQESQAVKSLAASISESYIAQENHYKTHKDDEGASDTCQDNRIKMVCHPAVYGNLSICVESGSVGSTHYSRNTSLRCHEKFMAIDEQKKKDAMKEITADQSKLTYLVGMLQKSYEMCVCGDGVNKRYADAMYAHRTCYGLISQAQEINSKLIGSNKCIKLDGLNDNNSFYLGTFAKSMSLIYDENMQARVRAGLRSKNQARGDKDADRKKVDNMYFDEDQRYADVRDIENTYKSYYDGSSKIDGIDYGKDQACKGVDFSNPGCSIKVSIAKDGEKFKATAEFSAYDIKGITPNASDITWSPAGTADTENVLTQTFDSLTDGQEIKVTFARKLMNCSGSETYKKEGEPEPTPGPEPEPEPQSEDCVAKLGKDHKLMIEKAGDGWRATLPEIIGSGTPEISWSPEGGQSEPKEDESEDDTKTDDTKTDDTKTDDTKGEEDSEAADNTFKYFYDIEKDTTVTATVKFPEGNLECPVKGDIKVPKAEEDTPPTEESCSIDLTPTITSTYIQLSTKVMLEDEDVTSSSTIKYEPAGNNGIFLKKDAAYKIKVTASGKKGDVTYECEATQNVQRKVGVIDTPGKGPVSAPGSGLTPRGRAIGTD